MRPSDDELDRSIQLDDVVILERNDPIEAPGQGGRVSSCERVGDQDHADDVGGEIRQVFAQTAPVSAEEERIGARGVTVRGVTDRPAQEPTITACQMNGVAELGE